MNLSFVPFAVVGFLAVVLSLEGLYNVWASRSSAEAKRIAARLAAISGEVQTRASIERSMDTPRMPRFNALLCSVGAGRRLQTWVTAAGVMISPGELILMSAALFAFGLFLPGLIGKPLMFGVTLGLGLAVLPWWRVARQRRARVERIESQFPEAMDLMARAMRAGHAFPSAIRMVGEEMADPLARDFRLLFDEMNYGVPANEALTRLAQRLPLPDVSYFVVAVMIQRETGGNLAELLDKIASLVRERLKLHGEIRTLSAEGKLSAIILTCLPFGVALAVNLTNPEFMSLLWTDPLGLRMIGVSMFMMLMGTMWMRNTIRIRV